MASSYTDLAHHVLYVGISDRVGCEPLLASSDVRDQTFFRYNQRL